MGLQTRVEDKGKYAILVTDHNDLVSHDLERSRALVQSRPSVYVFS